MPHNDMPTPKYSIHDFMVDFLGGLVPGSLFLVGACVAILPAIYFLFCLSSDSGIVALTTYFDPQFNLGKCNDTRWDYHPSRRQPTAMATT